MKITWRGDDNYEFNPGIISGGKDKQTRNSNIHSPIFGADTESVQLTDRYEPQCFTISDPYSCDSLIWLPERSQGLLHFMDHFVYSYAAQLFEDQEKYAFLYFHNLAYDWLQLVKEIPSLLEMSRIGVGLETDKEIFSVGLGRGLPPAKISLKKHGLFTGTAPHLGMEIKVGSDKFDLFWRDTFSFFPSSLAKVAKDLNLPIEKMDRQLDLGNRDFRIEGDSEDKFYFEKYAKLDSRITRLIAEKGIVPLHLAADMTKIRVSAPSYAIGLLFSMMDEDMALKTGDEDAGIMQLVFDTYRGGRTGGIYHGKVENVSVLDFHSSYPASMLCLPSFSPAMQYVRVDDLSIENVLEILEETGNCFLRVSGIEHDPKYPALITTTNGMLTPIHGEFKNIATTGVELLVGVRSGTLEITEIHDMVVLLDFEEEPFLPFREFASSAYIRKKNAEKGSVEYSSAKLALNASYGKLIESRSQTLIGASDAHHNLPYIETLEQQFAGYYYQKYMEAIDMGSSLEEQYGSILDEIIESFDEETREEMKTKMFGDFNISGRVYGRNAIPAAASLITATSRARLCAVIKILESLYWDTDSSFDNNDLTEDEITERLLVATEWLPKNVREIIPLRIGEELGDLAFEIRNANGYLAGTKRYFLTDGTNIKSATHGIPALPFDEQETVIQALATGANYKYESRQRPLKAKEAKSSSDIGSFRSKIYRPKFELDDRLEWQQTPTGWIGSVREIQTIQEKKPTEKQIQAMIELEELHGGIDPNSDLDLTEFQTEWDIVSRIREYTDFIRIPDPGSRFRSEYEKIDRSLRSKLFRKGKGIPLDEIADEMKIPLGDLLEKLIWRD